MKEDLQANLVSSKKPFLSLALNSAEMQENLDGVHVGFGDNRRRNMGLRENPKKSKRVSSTPKLQRSICDQCGKGFKSDKALFGHMRLHRKRKAGVVKGIVEIPNPTKKKRSERRYNKINSCSNNSSLSNLNHAASSSSVSCDPVDEGLEDIALCLLMLSNGGFCSFYDDQVFSDDDSVKIDTNFSGVSAQTTNEDHGNVIEVQNSSDLGCGCVSFKEKDTGHCNVNQGFFKSNQENQDPGPSFDFLKKPVFDVQTENQAELHDMGCGYVSYEEEANQENPEPGSRFDCLKKSVFDVGTENQAGLHDTEIKDQTNGSTVDCKVENQAELYDTEIKDGVKDTIIAGNPLKHGNHNKYICKICNKNFKSGQSLGGHKLHCPTSRRYRANLKTKTETEILIHDQKAECTTSDSENRVEELGGDEKKNKRERKHHKCPVCCKIFGSGQALGGHMRAHFYGKLGSDEKVFDVVSDVSDPEIPPIVCESNQQTLEISGAVLVGVVAVV